VAHAADPFPAALLAVIALTAAPYGTLMPAIVHEAIRRQRRATLGVPGRAAGLGAVCGTLLLAARRNVRGLVRFVVVAALVAGHGTDVRWRGRGGSASLAMMVAIGLRHPGDFGLGQHEFCKTIVDDDKRGSVMSPVHPRRFSAVVAFGGLLAGVPPTASAPPNTVFAGGIACVLAALYMARHLR